MHIERFEVKINRVTHTVRKVRGDWWLFYHDTMVAKLEWREVELLTAAFNAGVDEGMALKSAIDSGNLQG